MSIEKTQLKFAKSKQTGELIGFVSRQPLSNKLKGVREDSPFSKKICLLAKELQGCIKPNKLYSVELKPMRGDSGYVIVAATPMLFEAHIDTTVVPHQSYRVTVAFGNKTIYFDPKDGKNISTNTISGVVKVLRMRDDLAFKNKVIDTFIEHAEQLLRKMNIDAANQ